MKKLISVIEDVKGMLCAFLDPIAPYVVVYTFLKFAFQNLSEPNAWIFSICLTYIVYFKIMKK